MTPDMIAVDIHSFRNATRDINFDIYIKLSEDNYAHVFSRTTGLDYKRLAQYTQKGVQELFVKREDHPLYTAFVAKPAHMIFDDPNTPQEKKIATLLNMTEQAMAELFAQVPVSEETAESSQRVIRNYVELLAQAPNTLAILLKLVSHGEYLYYHSIAVAIFSMFIAKAAGQFNKRTLEIISMGGFLHDIGMTQIPKEISCASTDLTEEQWKIMHTHPTLGLRMIENTPNLPDEVRYIVYQHHEEPGTRGYPNGLGSSVIYPPAKIVAVADGFSALISRRPFREAFSVERAIAILQQEEHKYDPALVRIMASMFLHKKAA